MSAPSGFSTRLVVALGGAIMLLFAASLLLGRGGVAQGDISGANSFSRSAVGYRALYEALDKTGFRVTRASRDVLTALGPEATLVLAEPGDLSGAEIQRKIAAAKTTLVILPKYFVQADEAHVGWIDKATPVPPDFAKAILFGIDPQPQIARAPAPPGWTENALKAAPAVAGEMQLARGAKLKPLVGAAGGALVGEIVDDKRRIVVLADPDPLENHGLGKAGNAAFAAALFGALGGPNQTLVFDETIHGFHSASEDKGDAPDLAAALLGFPLNLALAQMALGIALLAAAAVGRFGAPQVPPRPLGLGKRGLVANIAALGDYGGHHAATLRGYIEAVARDAARALRAPPQQDLASLSAWLDRASEARGAKLRCAPALEAAASAADNELPRLLKAAQDMHAWKEEVLNGAV